MAQSPYREAFTLDTDINVKLEKHVANLLKEMSKYTNIPEGELVNTAMRRFIATHNDYLPKELRQKT